MDCDSTDNRRFNLPRRIEHHTRSSYYTFSLKSIRTKGGLEWAGVVSEPVTATRFFFLLGGAFWRGVVGLHLTSRKTAALVTREPPCPFPAQAALTRWATKRYLESGSPEPKPIAPGMRYRPSKLRPGKGSYAGVEDDPPAMLSPSMAIDPRWSEKQFANVTPLILRSSRTPRTCTTSRRRTRRGSRTCSSGSATGAPGPPRRGPDVRRAGRVAGGRQHDVHGQARRRSTTRRRLEAEDRHHVPLERRSTRHGITLGCRRSSRTTAQQEVAGVHVVLHAGLPPRPRAVPRRVPPRAQRHHRRSTPAGSASSSGRSTSRPT